MMFWDASAVLPLCIEENHSKSMLDLVKKDGALIVWWGTGIECHSAFARLNRKGFLDSSGEEQVHNVLSILSDSWSEIEPGDDVRNTAIRLLNTHPLKAADSLQLAAALIWANKLPGGYQFICLDNRLRSAAKKEGFTILPRRI